METIISGNLKRLRKEKKLTQLELAKLSGVSQATVSRIEDGGRVPRVAIIQKLAKALGQTPESLVKGAIERVEYLGEHAGFNAYVSNVIRPHNKTLRQARRVKALKDGLNQADSWETVEKGIMEGRISEARRLVDEALKLANEANVQIVKFSGISFAVGLLLGASTLMFVVGLLS